MAPKLKTRSQHTFDRIGDSYAPYIDGEHFMGRSAFDDHWLKFNAPVNVRHEKDKCLIDVALPGFIKEDIDLFLDQEGIHIHAIRSKKQNTFVHKELVKDNINRSFSLPPHADKTAISAKLIDGVVKITIPIKEAQVAHKIEIEE